MQQQLIMLNMDAPEHTRLRSLVNRGFTPRMIDRLEARSQEICDELVDDAIAEGEGDFVTLCAAELPLIMIAELMGVPYEDRHKLFEWSNTMIGFDDPEFQNPRPTRSGRRWSIIVRQRARREAARATPRTTSSAAVSAGRARQRPLRARVRHVLHPAGRRRQRDDPQRHQRRHARAHRAPRPVGSGSRTTRASSSPAAEEIVRWVDAGDGSSGARRSPTSSSTARRSRRATRSSSSTRRPTATRRSSTTRRLRHRPHAEPARRLRRRRPALLPRPHLARLEIDVIFRTLAEKVDHVEQTGPVRRLRSNFINGITHMPVRLVAAN